MELAFDQPSTGERVELKAAYPDDLKRALALLSSKS
jgi:hypothetical protein